MKFWFISYSLISVFEKSYSFNILPYYKLKVIERKTLKIIPIHLFFETEPSAQSHKTLAKNPGPFCNIIFYFYSGFALFWWFMGATVQVFTVEMSYYLNSLKTTFVSSLQGEGHVQLQHFQLANQMHPIPLDLSPVSKKENHNLTSLSGMASTPHAGL